MRREYVAGSFQLAVGRLLPWLGGVVVAVVVGGAIGVSGLVGRPSLIEQRGPVVSSTTPGFACPAGDVVTEFAANERVLAVGRSEDSTWLVVRDTHNLFSTVWVPASVITVDPDQSDLASLPVGGCPEPIVTLPAPVVESAPVPVPQPNVPQPPPVTPPADTTAPTIQQAWATPSAIVCPSNVGGTYVNTTSVRLIGADNVGITSASISWSGAHSGGPTAMSPSGGEWRYAYTMPAQSSGPITFTLVARDAAGNTSTPAIVNVPVTCIG